MSAFRRGARDFYASTTNDQLKIISRHLDTNGDGTGTKNANGNYSSAEEIFYIQPPEGAVYTITRLLVLTKGAKTTFYTDAYGSRVALSNGVFIRTRNDSGTIVDFTDNIGIKTNGCWGRICYDSEIYSSAVANNNTYLRARFTFEKSGQLIHLNGNINERFEVVLNDNFALATAGSNAIVEHYFLVQGYEKTNAS